MELCAYQAVARLHSSHFSVVTLEIYSNNTLTHLGVVVVVVVVSSCVLRTSKMHTSLNLVNQGAQSLGISGRYVMAKYF